MRNIRSRFTALAGLTVLTGALLMTSQSSVQARPNTDGRWKIADDGSCVFDANDTGADQCDPTPGRNKIGDDGQCYFDANDIGPDQCTLGGH
jgi:hypothetical protein